MKKLVLPAVFMLAAAFSNAQTCVPGYAPKGAYENFSSATEPSNTDKSGFYNWAPKIGTVDKHPLAGDSIVRDPANKALKAFVSQGEGDYVPFGTSFGNIGGVSTAKPFTVDLSTNSKFSITVTNNDPAITVNLRFTIVDTAKNEIDTYGVVPTPAKQATGKTYLTDTLFSNAWMYIMEVVVKPGLTVTYSGDFANGGKADYARKRVTTGFDFRNVSGIHYTVINNSQNKANGYAPFAISKLPITINSVTLGTCKAGTGISELGGAVTSSVIFPNPTSESFTAAIELKEISNVKVTLNDLTGREISLIANTKTASLNEVFNVSALAKGTYMVKFNVNGADAVTKLLLVK